MRLAIADPPYLGRAALWYGGKGRMSGFVGSKPRQWTEWVLDMLGYDPTTDVVEDLFRGSGAVSAHTARLI